MSVKIWQTVSSIESTVHYEGYVQRNDKKNLNSDYFVCLFAKFEGYWRLCLEIKWLGREADHSPPSSALQVRSTKGIPLFPARLNSVVLIW
jgi:hypothetical protein